MTFDQFPALLAVTRADVIGIVHFLVALYLSLSVHEAAHAWMANRCGDDTARLMGRMTLNPFVHIDPIGTVLMPLIMVVSSFAMPGVHLPLIGWAKPVPVNPVRFRNMRRGEILVSFAGPASNFILAACAFAICAVIVSSLGIVNPDTQGGYGTSTERMLETGTYTVQERIGQGLYEFIFSLLVLNLILGLFNLIPIAPLDGSHILRVFVSRRAAEAIDRLLMPPFNLLALLFVALPLVRLAYTPVYFALVDVISSLMR
ncbi:MAG: site-2 protease family protein [Verrucomicrobia bacterium]|nr:site-2 protease family protein [Verrucomicrobiota bacterium]